MALFLQRLSLLNPFRLLACWLGLDWPHVSPIAKAAILIGLLLAAINLQSSIHDLQHFPGMDQRSRIVGARAWRQGLDPYFFWLGPQTPPELWDPARTPDVPRCTYPPTVLALFAVTCQWPYRTQRLLWGAIEWLTLALAIAALQRLCPGRRARELLAVLTLIFFAGDYFWRLHVERGQYYIYLLLLLACGCWLLLLDRRWSWTGALLLGLAAALRPTLLLLPLVLLFAHRWRLALTALAATTVAVALTLPWGIAPWISYVHAADSSSEGRALGYFNGPIFTTPPPPPPSMPQVVEGYNWTTGGLTSHTISATLLSYLRQYRQYSTTDALRLNVEAIAALVLLAIAAGWFARRSPLPLQLALAICPAFLLDYLTPCRYAYADILFLLPLALTLPLLLRHKPLWPLLALILLSLLLAHQLSMDSTAPDPNWYLGTWTRALVPASAYTAALLSLLSNRRVPCSRPPLPHNLKGTSPA